MTSSRLVLLVQLPIPPPGLGTVEGNVPLAAAYLKLFALGSKVTADAGLPAYRERDEALGLTEMSGEVLGDSRLGRNKQHVLLGLLRQSIYSRLAGYEDVNDAERLCVDRAMRHVVGGRASREDKHAASPSEMGRFETEIFSAKPSLKALMDLSGRWIDSVLAASV